MSRTRIMAALAAAALVALSAGVAFGAGATKSKATASFSTKASKKPTNFKLNMSLGKGTDGNYAILTDTEVRLPAGTKINKTTVPACMATDDQIANDPGGANKLCPANTKIGDVTADVIIVPPALHLAGPMFNRPGNKVIVELLSNGAPAYDIDGTIKGTKMDFPLPNAEMLGTKPTKITVTIPKHGTAKKPFLRTPASCPKSGKWKGSVFNQYGGAATAVDNPKFSIACTPPKSR